MTSTTSAVETLTTEERQELAKLETTITAGLRSFIEVGSALADIQASRLYRETHPTFEGYCQERWGIERAHAYRLVGAAEIVSRLSPIGDMPTAESQVRPLAKLPEEEQADAWQEAVAEAPDGKPTAKIVSAVVERRTNVATGKTHGMIDEDHLKALDVAGRAIGLLKEIRSNNKFRGRAGQIVSDWIALNMPDQSIEVQPTTGKADELSEQLKQDIVDRIDMLPFDRVSLDTLAWLSDDYIGFRIDDIENAIVTEHFDEWYEAVTDGPTYTVEDLEQRLGCPGHTVFTFIRKCKVTPNLYVHQEGDRLTNLKFRFSTDPTPPSPPAKWVTYT